MRNEPIKLRLFSEAFEITWRIGNGAIYYKWPRTSNGNLAMLTCRKRYDDLGRQEYARARSSPSPSESHFLQVFSIIGNDFIVDVMSISRHYKNNVREKALPSPSTVSGGLA